LFDEESTILQTLKGMILEHVGGKSFLNSGIGVGKCDKFPGKGPQAIRNDFFVQKL